MTDLNAPAAPFRITLTVFAHRQTAQMVFAYIEREPLLARGLAETRVSCVHPPCELRDASRTADIHALRMRPACHLSLTDVSLRFLSVP